MSKPMISVSVFPEWRFAYLDMCGMVFKSYNGEEIGRDHWIHINSTIGCDIHVTDMTIPYRHVHLYGQDALTFLGWQ